MLKARCAYIVAALLIAAAPAFAQDADLSRIREEMKQLQRSYEERMQALERRLTEAEGRAGKAGAAQANHSRRNARPKRASKFAMQRRESG